MHLRPPSSTTTREDLEPPGPRSPEEPLRRGGAQGGVWVKPLNWMPNSGVRGEPCTGVANNSNISRCPECRVSTVPCVLFAGPR